jgi:vacuolar-type H+-ATPase subunit F/Vma7
VAYFSGSINNSKIIIKLAEKLNITADFLLLGKEELKLTENEIELLKLFDKLEEKEQYKIISMIKEKIKNINEEKE